MPAKKNADARETAPKAMASKGGRGRFLWYFNDFDASEHYAFFLIEGYGAKRIAIRENPMGKPDEISWLFAEDSDLIDSQKLSDAFFGIGKSDSATRQIKAMFLEALGSPKVETPFGLTVTANEFGAMAKKLGLAEKGGLIDAKGFLEDSDAMAEEMGLFNGNVDPKGERCPVRMGIAFTTLFDLGSLGWEIPERQVKEVKANE